MRLETLIVPALLGQCLGAQEPLPVSLAKAPGLNLPQLQELQLRVAAASARPDQKAYAEAFLGYCLVNQLRKKDPEQAQDVIKRNLKALEGRQDVESMALLGTCLAQKMEFSPMTAMFLNPKALALFEQALKLSPGNPRALFLKGVHLFHTPAFFGGGPAKAMPILQAAVKAAEAEAVPQDPWAPHWGRLESLCWLAIAQGETGLFQEAEATVLRARAVDPNHGNVAFAARRIQASRAKKS